MVVRIPMRIDCAGISTASSHYIARIIPVDDGLGY